MTVDVFTRDADSFGDYSFDTGMEDYLRFFFPDLD